MIKEFGFANILNKKRKTRNMKKYIILLVVVILITLFSGCLGGALMPYALRFRWIWTFDGVFGTIIILFITALLGVVTTTLLSIKIYKSRTRGKINANEK